MKKSVVAVLAMSVAATAMANGNDEFGGIIKVYDVKIKADAVQYKAGKNNIQVNDDAAKLSAKILAKDKGSLKGYIIDYDDGDTSFLHVDKHGWEQNDGYFDFTVPKMIDTEDLLDTGARKLTVEGDTNEVDIVKAQGYGEAWYEVYYQNVEFYGPAFGNYKAEVKEQKGVDTERLSINFSGTGYGYIDLGTDEDSDWYYATVKRSKIKYNKKMSEQWSEKFINAGGLTNSEDGVTAVNVLVNNEINGKTGDTDADFHLDWDD